MIKKILIFACISTASLHAMEQDPLTRKYPWLAVDWRIRYNNTTIDVTKRSLFEMSDKVDYTVVGHHEQRILFKNANDKYYDRMGTTYHDGRTAYQKYEDPTNPSDNDDTYEPYYPQKTALVCHAQEIQSFLIKVVEPCIVQKQLTPKKKSLKDYIPFIKKKADCYCNCENEALNNTPITVSENLEKNLADCYHNVLHFPVGLALMNHQSKDTVKDKRIVLPTLGANVGFPRKEAVTIAVTNVLAFIKKYPNVYERIYFIVEKQSDFDLYKDLLEKEPWEKIMLLLYCIHQDSSTIFSLLPSEIKMQIFWLLRWLL